MMIETVNQKNQPKTVEAKDFFSLQKNNESRISFHGNIDLLCPELQSLNISFCNLLKIPEFIFTLMNLTELNLSNNCLTSLPNEIGNLHNLSILDLSRNKLTSLPTSVKCMHNLNSLDASYNYFSEVPDVLYIGLGLLKILDLSFNEICNFDSAPKCINTLKALNLSYNMLKGLPKWIFFVLCQLIVLDVSGNCIYLDFQVNDFYTARVFQSLQFLNIENCQLSFEKCKFLSHFKNLEVLYIGNKTKKNKVNLNYLGNIQMNAFKNLRTLKCLYLQNVYISSLDSGLNYLEKLEVLDLSGNLLSWLPECLCDLTSLKVLNLMSNELIFLPTNIGKLINLQELHLGNNNLYYLPEGIYNLNNLNNLEYVDLYNNKLEDINFVIFKKKKLKGIDLESNCLVHKFSVLDIDIKLQYESLKNSLRKHFGFVNSRCDLQIMKSSSENESSIEHNSSWSSYSETITDDEDIVVAVSEKHCQEEFEKEDWENEIVDVKENDYFNPNGELERLKDKAVNLKKSLNDTLDESRKKNAEYVEAKNHYRSEIRRLGNEQNCLDQKLCSLDLQIVQCELKLKDALEDYAKGETEFNDNTFELTRVREEIGNLDKTYGKTIQRLADELKEAKAKLKQQLLLQKQKENNLCAALKSKAKEIDEKFKNLQKSFDERVLKLEETYKLKTDPLVYRLSSLEADLKTAEAELEQKPKDLAELKKENLKLEKKYEQMLETLEAKLTDESTLSTDALAKGLDYFKDRPQALTPDAILGILIVRANLQWIFGRIQLNSPTSHKLESLLKECNEILNLNRGEIYPVLSNNIWDDSAQDLRRGNFDTDKYKYSLPKFNSCESVDSYFMKGTPEDSDFCINELINSECQVSEKCWFSETNKMDHSGYKTTHRLLYFIIATQLKCEEKNPKKFFGIKLLKHNLCQRLLSEAQALFEEPHFPLTRDLFLEQIALCGLEGYEEFANHVWKENVESWQNSEGCFGHDVNFKLCRINKLQNVDSKRRTKRTDTTVDGCHTHVTAVALSSLAFFLRCDAEAVNFVGGIDP